MKYQKVVVESLAYALPHEVWTSADIEAKLAPTYERLKLPEGRLQLMSGIEERRVWPADTLPSHGSVSAGRALLEKAKCSSAEVECLVHTSVSRDFVEPATASVVHRELQLPGSAPFFDISNACLGFLNGILTLANMIELGQIKRGMVVAGENGRPLLEHTIKALLDPEVTRQSIKPHFASLTIGCGAVAALVSHESLVNEGHHLRGGICTAATQHNHLCQGDRVGSSELQMSTDSEELLKAGVALAKSTWDSFCGEHQVSADSFSRYICHQVGSAHRRELYKSLGLDTERDFSTFEKLGNVGSVSLPITLAKAEEAGKLEAGARVALLGIGSGLGCAMLDLTW